jgi:ATP-dependent Clp protease ATP-binding subunit ClpC
MKLAQDAAREFGQDYWGTEHLLIGLAAVDGGIAQRVLSSLGYSGDRFQRDVLFLLGTGGSEIDEPPPTPRIERVLAAAEKDCLRRGNDEVSTAHLLSSLIKEREGVAVMLLELPGTGLERLAGRLEQSFRDGLRDE